MYTLKKEFNLILQMLSCDQCGAPEQTRFHVIAEIQTLTLCPRGYIVNNEDITDESLCAQFSGGRYRGSCEQLAASIAEWLAGVCGTERVHSVDVCIDNMTLPAPTNSCISYRWTPLNRIPRIPLQPVADEYCEV